MRLYIKLIVLVCSVTSCNSNCNGIICYIDFTLNLNYACEVLRNRGMLMNRLDSKRISGSVYTSYGFSPRSNIKKFVWNLEFRGTFRGPHFAQVCSRWWSGYLEPWLVFSIQIRCSLVHPYFNRPDVANLQMHGRMLPWNHNYAAIYTYD